MGRHGMPASRGHLPWELIGWTAFAGLVAAVALRVTGDSWGSALLVLATGSVAVLVLVVLTLVSPRAGASSGDRRHDL